MPRLPAWLAAAAARLSQCPNRSARRRLALEGLEAREVPAAFTWNQTQPGAFSWNDDANWDGPAGFPNSFDDTATLTAALDGNQVITLATPITVAGLTVGSTGAGAYTIAGNDNTLTFDANGGTATLTATAGAAGNAILGGVVLASPLTVTNADADVLSIFGPITGTGTLTVTGPLALPNGADLPATITLAGTGPITSPSVLYTVSFFDGGLYAFDGASGATLATLSAPYAAGGLIGAAAGLTVGPDGDLYISNQASGTVTESILRYDLDTMTLSPFITTAQLGLARTGTGNTNVIFAPGGLAFGPTDGDLYVTLTGGTNSAGDGAVIRFDVAGGNYAGTFAEVADNFYQPSAVAFGPGADNTSLYVTSAIPVVLGGQLAGFTGRITRVVNAGTAPVQGELIAPGAGGLSYPAGLTFGPDGGLYVADLAAFEEFGSGTGKIVRYDADGSNPTTFNQGGPGAGSLSLQFPSGVLFDAADRLVTANLGPTRAPTLTGSVYRYLATGALDTILVSSARFPDTGMTQGGMQTSGVTPSQLALVAGDDLSVAGVIAPAGGTTVGTLAVPALTLAGTATYSFDVTAGGNDLVASTGTVALNSANASLVLNGFVPAPGSSFTIVTAPLVTGTFNGLANNQVFLADGLQFRIAYTATAVTVTRVEAPEITSAMTATFFTGRGNTFTVTATGFPTPTLSSGALPAGLTFDAGTGVLSGTPTVAPGDYPITFTSTNDVGTDMEVLTLTVVAGVAPMITTANNAAFVGGTGGTFDVNATGTPDPVFAIPAGAPAGVTIDPTTGVITVTSAVANGVFTFNVVADNDVTPDAMQLFTLTVGTVPEVTSGMTATFFTGRDNTFTVTATGSPTPTLSSGALPAGLMFDAGTGILSGTPTVAPGDYVITFTATNAVGADAEDLTLTVVAGVAPMITTANNAAFVGGAGGTFDVNATGTPDATFSLTGTVPAGVTIDPTTGLITVGPAVPNGVYTFTVSADNDVSPDAMQPFTLTVGSLPEVTSGGSTTFITGVPASFPLTATGSPTPTIMVTGTLPTGITFNSTTNTLEGTPSGAAGSFPVTVTATNAVGSDAETLTITLQAGAAPVITTANSLLVGTATGGTLDVNATGNPPPTFALAGGPVGVTIDPTTGVLTVDPGVPAMTYTFDITATNTLGSVTQGFTLTVGTSPTFTSANNAVFVGGQLGSFGLTATGSPAPTFAFTAGTLPAGITLSPSGTLSGTATQVGTFTATFTASNGVSPDATQQFTLTIGQAPVITSVNNTTVAQGGTFTVTATGTPAPTFSVAGQPAGITIDATTGVLAVGAGVAAGNYALTLSATNAVGGFSQILNLTVTAGPVVVPPELPSRLSASGQSNGGAALFDPNAAGAYATAPTATVNPFGGLGVLVRSAVGDVNGDGVDDTIVVTGPGTPVRFAVVSGTDNRTLLVAPTAAFAGSEGFTGGAFVSTGDLDGDGRDDVVLSPDQGGGARVTVFRLPAGGTLTVAANFLGIDDDSFRGGARTAVGDVNRDGIPDLAVAAGFLGGPRVALFDGATVLTTRGRLVNDFFAFPGSDAQTLRNGAFVAIGDVTGDGFGELIFGGGPGGAPRVFVLDGARVMGPGGVAGAQAAPLANFFVANNDADRGGARVGVVDADGDGRADVAVGSGPGVPARVRVYRSPTVATAGEPAAFQDLFPFTGEVLTDGIYVS